MFLCLESHRFVHPRAVHHRYDSGLGRGRPFFCKVEKCVLRQLCKNQDVHVDFLKTVLAWILHEVSILEFKDQLFYSSDFTYQYYRGFRKFLPFDRYLFLSPRPIFFQPISPLSPDCLTWASFSSSYKIMLLAASRTHTAAYVYRLDIPSTSLLRSSPV